jgi:hypothetical protein
MQAADNMVTAKFTVSSITISAQRFFYDPGQLINFISNDRFSAEASKKVP